MLNECTVVRRFALLCAINRKGRGGTQRDLSVNGDGDAPAFQVAFEESGEVLIRADVSIADKDLSHETPHWDLPLKRLPLNWRFLGLRRNRCRNFAWNSRQKSGRLARANKRMIE
jgi:hypothetical protein